jgi:uncharacterized protein (DUF488 family)
MNRLLTIYTIGHSNHSAQHFVRLLGSHGIKLVADVRSYPTSKYNPHFRKRELQKWLPEEGIEYLYMGKNLGGIRDEPWLRSGKGADYGKIAELPQFRNSLRDLVDIAGERTTCIMCGEENPEQCHRQHLIARELLGLGVNVLHIFGDGSLKQAWRSPTQPSLGFTEAEANSPYRNSPDS